ncbi:MAG: hypothetical protein ACFWUH_04760 [Limosilactobacillus fermentum]|jgi:competence protein ComFA
MQKEELYGRRVLINQALPAPFGLTGEKTMDERGRWVTCRRCNARLIKERVRLPSGGLLLSSVPEFGAGDKS